MDSLLRTKALTTCPPPALLLAQLSHGLTVEVNEMDEASEEVIENVMLIWNAPAPDRAIEIGHFLRLKL